MKNVNSDNAQLFSIAPQKNQAATCPTPTHAWRDDITGLRALAVIPVLLYHAFPSVAPGGFFGVDVFFVISGYLISGIIFRGLATGVFSWLSFYDKRIRRILPNLFSSFDLRSHRRLVLNVARGLSTPCQAHLFLRLLL